MRLRSSAPDLRAVAKKRGFLAFVSPATAVVLREGLADLAAAAFGAVALALVFFIVAALLALPVAEALEVVFGFAVALGFAAALLAAVAFFGAAFLAGVLADLAAVLAAVVLDAAVLAAGDLLAADLEVAAFPEVALLAPDVALLADAFCAADFFAAPAVDFLAAVFVFVAVLRFAADFFSFFLVVARATASGPRSGVAAGFAEPAAVESVTGAADVLAETSGAAAATG